MSHVVAKLGFVHRRLWQRDGTYRAAVLLGPPPLLGAALAFFLWTGLHAMPSRHETPAPPPWATGARSLTPSASDPPRVVPPGLPLPAGNAGSAPPGFAFGWQAAVQPVEINAAMAANILPDLAAPLMSDGLAIDLGRIVAAAPSKGRFVGTGIGMLAIRTPGTYALALRAELTGSVAVDCLQRLAFGGQPVISNITLDVTGPKTLDFGPAVVSLQPGLYPLGIAFGCWHGETEAGAGRLNLVLRPIEDAQYRLPQPNEILHPSAGAK